MRPTKEPAILTVAGFRDSPAGDAIEVLFNERQQIYTLPRAASVREAVHGRLREALDRKAPVKAMLNPRRGVVERVTEPAERELREFEKLRIPLENPEKTMRIDVSRIDPTTFNIVDYYLKIPCFKLCTKVIPSYKVAKDIFDFCAAQSCHLPGPYAISPCIPFQYVRDGCYARAHKMRQIIEDQYGYCSEKIFSFALGNDTLAVRANKWGGCCVWWWYHVAPLVRVRVRIKLPPFANLDFTLAMVIDPSMFDKPVLLSSWLMAQEEKTCADYAKVTMYSIQPSSAYWPMGGPNSFGTDPTYTLTNQTLLAYKNLTTCP
jgi:Glutaminase